MMRNAEPDQIYNETAHLLQDGIKTTQQTTEFSLHLAQQQFEQLQEFKNQLHQQRQQQRQLESNISRSNRMVIGLFMIGLATLIIGLGAFGWLTYQLHAQHQQQTADNRSFTEQLYDIQQGLSFHQSAPIQPVTEAATSATPAPDQSLVQQELSHLIEQYHNQLQLSLAEVTSQLNLQDQKQQTLAAELTTLKRLLETKPAQQTVIAKPTEPDLSPLLQQQQAQQVRIQRLNDLMAQSAKELAELNRRDLEQNQQTALQLQQIEKKLHELTQSLTETPIRGDYIYRNPQQFNP